jgi:transcriptional regulator with XRE-family HTH domain
MYAIVKPGKLPENLKALRLWRGWSQREAAKRLNLKSPATISHYETGRRKISLDFLLEIERVYDIKVEIRLVSK